MRWTMFRWNFLFASGFFVQILVSKLLAMEDLGSGKYGYVSNIIWGSIIRNDNTVQNERKIAPNKVRNDDAYQQICNLYNEYMFVASPFETSASGKSELYKSDNNLYITVVFGFLTDFWGRPIYDHAALLCEHYDDENQKISANTYHLTMRDDWKMRELVGRCGYGYFGYKIEEQPKDKIVELMMCHPKYKSKYVRYHPYKTFRTSKTEKTKAVLAKLKQSSQEDYCSYSLYGAQSAPNDILKGNHNCISFVIDILWQFGIFQNRYTRHDVLAYSNAYSLEVLSPYARLHFLTRRLIRVPETLKYLVDDPEMIRKECEFKAHPSANMENHRPVRHGNAYALVNDVLKRNIVQAMLASIDELSINDLSVSFDNVIEEAEKIQKEDVNLSLLRNYGNNIYTRIPGNTYLSSWLNRFGMVLRRFIR
jgi:hypothetical protein